MKPVLFPIATSLRLLPNAVHSEVLTRVVNHIIQNQWIEEDLDYLEGKRLCLSVSDTGNEIVFRVQGRRLRRAPTAGGWDVRFAGRLEDFWKLATRAEDPDTLFFHRKLAIEGDTDAGLYLKNLLDALDFDLDAHLKAVVGPRLAPTLKATLERAGLPERFDRLRGTVL